MNPTKIKRRSYNKTRNFEKLKAPITYELLERMLMYLLYYRPIDQGLISLMKKLFDTLDPESFSVFEERKNISEMILIALDVVIKDKIADEKIVKDAIISKDTDSVYSKFIEQTEANMQSDPSLINEEIVQYIGSRVKNILQYEVLFRERDNLSEIAQKISSGDTSEMSDISKEFSEVASKIINNNHNVESSVGIQSSYILGTDSFKRSIGNSIKELNRPSSTVKTGFRLLNKMLKGGFKSGKHYVFLGAPGTGKSIMLNNIGYWAIKYNNDMRPSNPAMKPLVLYISQENTIEETDERNYSLYLPESVTQEKEFQERTADELVDLYTKAGVIGSPVNFAMEYYENRAISTIDLDAIVDKYAIQGYEIVMVIHDYIKRIRGAEEVGDPFIDYASIVNEERSFAARHRFPFITVMQINRESAVKIEEARKGGKDLEKVVNSGMIGQSYGIYENTDWCAVLTPEIDPVTQRKYLCLIKLKSRFKSKYKNSFLALPFDGDSIRLDADVGRTDSGVLEAWGDHLGSYNPSAEVGKKMPVSRRHSDKIENQI